MLRSEKLCQGALTQMYLPHIEEVIINNLSERFTLHSTISVVQPKVEMVLHSLSYIEFPK